jgi:salicylate hydroxylase
MTQPPMRVGIVGAGIGGLSLALALRERGVQADVFEQASELTEIGAAIGLAANAIREFARLGLVGELTAASTIPTELIYRHWRDGSRIAAHPVRQDDWYEKQFGAPWFGIHRADLQKILSAAFDAEHVYLGCRLVNISEQADSVVLKFANGRTHEADLVVGAEPDPVGPVHGTSPAAVVPGPGSHHGRRRARDAAAPRAGREHLHRGRVRAGWAARRRPG